MEEVAGINIESNFGEQELTKEEIVAEIIKCRKDPLYYILKYCKISHPMKGFIPFEMYDFQKDLVVKIKDNRFVVVLKARQLGITTIAEAYALWLASFHTSKKIFIVANVGSTATNFISGVKEIIDHLPDFIKPKLNTNNRQSIEFNNGSKIKATSTTKYAGKSEAVSLLVFDEAAIIPNAKEIWTSASPTIATGGSVLVISTPKGVGNWFHQTYVDAEAGLNEFVPVKIMWNLHPDRDEIWHQTELKKLGEQMFAQEHGCDFLKSGNTVINPDDLDWYKKENHIVDPFQKTNFDNNLWIWKYPDYSKHYMVCADVARGDGADFSAFQVISVEDMEQVAEYKAKVPTDIYGHILVELATKYNNALLICENNSVSWATIQKIMELGYQNLYWSSKDILYIDPINWGVPDKDKIPGFTMGERYRPLIINKLEEVIRTHLFIFHSVRLFNELSTFVFDERSKKPTASQGFHDDLIIAAAMAMFVRSTSMRLLEATLSAYQQMPILFSKETTPMPMSSIGYRKQAQNPFIQNGQNIDWVARG